MSRPRVKITLIDRKGPVGCHRGHRVGDSWDFDTQRGEICPMAMHVAFFVHRHPALRRQHPGPKPWRGNFQLPRRRHAEHF